MIADFFVSVLLIFMLLSNEANVLNVYLYL